MAADDEMTAAQEAAFEIIATVGTAKSMYIGAIKKAKEGDIDGARADVASGTEIFNEGHATHLSLLQQSAVNSGDIEFSLILIHAEDQLMNAEFLKITAEEIITLYERIESIK
mgnify:CR=1 FL=1